jgi:trimeric autotransporter adhesin
MSNPSNKVPRAQWQFLSVCAILFAFAFCAQGQESPGTPTPAASASLPSVIRFSGKATDPSTKPLTGLVGITFSLYEQETGGPALWLETQNVQLDATGHYTVLLGTTKPEGLPAEIFFSGQARWIGVQVSGQAEQARVMLLTVPYAMKAGDAATVGGLPPSAFMLATPVASGGSLTSNAAGTGATFSATPAATSNVTTSGGAANTIPMFTTGTNIQNSVLTQTGTTVVNVAGKLNLPSTGTATATAANNSRPEDFVASAFNSTSKAAVAQTFQLQAEPAGNNTAAPSGNLSLLFGSGTAAPTETGLKINNKGVLTFAAGQTFPGTGKGTITGVTAGTALTGGGTTGTVTLNVDTTKVVTAVTAGTGLTGGGTGGARTLNLDTTKVPVLQSNNTFTGTEKFNGNVGVGATPSATGYTPLTLGGTTNFGTWLALANTSAGGHTWNIISAGSGNAEGAGNIGITDLTGKSTIWLEGNTNTANLTATGTVGAAAVVVTSTAGAAIIDADGFGTNAGGPTPGLRFGGGSSGEGIASNRVIGATKFGLDFYTNYTARMSILQSGQVAVGTASPGAQLGVVGSSNAFPGISTQGGSAASGSGQNGSDGIDAYGNSGDGAGTGGSGGVFSGGGPGASGLTGEGIVVFGGTNECIPICVPLNYAGDFQGTIFVKSGSYQPSAVMFIDHPSDPANKYLMHSSVESSDMKNIYDGTVTTDTNGEAVVALPDWFEALNRDFRYQLTTIGQPAQAWIASKIANHAFTIKTDKPNVEISWQVTGIRQDAWANAHRVIVEHQKSGREAGHYLHPELFGAPEESSITWARHPEMMKQQKEHRLNGRQAMKLAVTTK